MYPKSKLVNLGGEIGTVGTGWRPPLPDLRDYTDGHSNVVEMLKKLFTSSTNKLPTSVDLRKWFKYIPVEDQAQLGSCTANAAVGIVEYFEYRAFNKFVDGSRLFIYKTSRNLVEEEGDVGAFLRETMGALVLCGVPPEKYWPYTDKSPDFDKEPPAFVYAIADNYEAVKYFCYDPLGANITYKEVLDKVKKYLAAGIPSMFGFNGFPSFDQSNATGKIPFPCSNEQSKWGHAIVAIGYDDDKEITNTICNRKTSGALLIRNSWGTLWGDKGYGWLPYEYVLNGLANDFWSLIKMEWVDTNKFGF